MENINLLEFFPFAFLMHLTRTIIVFNIVHQILEDKYNSVVTFLSLTVTGMVYSYIFLPITNEKNEFLILTFYYLVLLFVLFFVTNASFFSRLISIIFSLIAYTVSALVSSIALTMF